MNEQVEQGWQAVPDEGASQEETVLGQLTGHETVDAVLNSLEELEHRPVDEHVAVFESAHEELRAALSEAADRPGSAAVD